MAFRIYVSSLAADRLAAARDLLRARVPNTPTLIVGASRGAADDLAREVAASLPATLGLQRVSLTQLAARSAIVRLAMEGHTPSTWLGAEAVAARAAFDAVAAAFAPVLCSRGLDARVFRGRLRARSRSCDLPASALSSCCVRLAVGRTLRTCSRASMSRSSARPASIARCCSRLLRKPSSAGASSATRRHSSIARRSSGGRGVHRGAYCRRRDRVRNDGCQRSRRHRAARSDGRHCRRRGA